MGLQEQPGWIRQAGPRGGLAVQRLIVPTLIVMQSDAPLDLTSMAQIQTILTAVQSTISAAVADGTFGANDVQQSVDSNVLAVRLGWLFV